MNRRKRILLSIPNLNGGGAERVMIHLLRHLDRDRFDLTFALGHSSGHFLDDVPKEVPTIVFGHERSYRTIPQLARYFRDRAFDLVFTMTAMNLAASIARIMVRSPVPLVLGARNNYTACLPAEASYPGVRARFIRTLYPRANLVIGVSQGVCDDLVANFGVPAERVLAIPNPLDLDRLHEMARAPNDHPWFAETDRVPVLVNVGKLMEAKGHFDLLDAFRVVRSRRPCRLLLLGQGPLEAAIRRRISELGVGDDVQLAGFQRNPYSFMSRASLFVLSSHWEGFPNVLSEAMACGAPVVSTDCPSGPSEIVTPGVTGLLVPVGAPKALAEAIDELLVDGARRERMGTAAKKTAHDRWAVPSIVGRYAQAFADVIARNPIAPRS